MNQRVFMVLMLLLLAVPAQAAERRIALVIGNANYQTGALPTPANDAGLVAQTLQAAGFDVTGARDLDLESLRRAFRDFVDKASSSSSDTVAFIYFSGYGLQLEGETISYRSTLVSRTMPVWRRKPYGCRIILNLWPRSG